MSPPSPENRGGPAVQPQQWSRTLIVQYLNLVPGNRPAQTRAQGLGERLFGREPAGIGRVLVFEALAELDFGRQEDTGTEPVRVALERGPDAGDFDDVSPDAEDSQGSPPRHEEHQGHQEEMASWCPGGMHNEELPPRHQDTKRTEDTKGPGCGSDPDGKHSPPRHQAHQGHKH